MFGRNDDRAGVRKVNPFDYVNDILKDKKNIIVDDQSEKEYNPFLTNRSLSYHSDCLFYAQEMNISHHLDKKLQFDYLINTIRPAKRKFSKWSKRKEDEDVNALVEYYGFSKRRAEQALSILSKEQIKEIKKRLEKGGVK